MVGLLALCSLGACHTTSASSKDAAPAVSDSDAAPAASGSDAASVGLGGAFASAFASAVCDSLADCCRRAGFDSSLCLATAQAQMTAIFALRTADPKVAFDEAAGANCINAYRAALTACTDAKL